MKRYSVIAREYRSYVHKGNFRSLQAAEKAAIRGASEHGRAVVLNHYMEPDYPVVVSEFVLNGDYIDGGAVNSICPLSFHLWLEKTKEKTSENEK